MAAVRQDLKVEQGASYKASFGAKQADGASFSLVGWSARAQVREEARSAVVVIDLTTENGGITIDGPDGSLMLNFSPENTAALQLTCQWDLFIYSPEGDAYRLVYGDIAPTLTVTRPR